MNQEKTGKFIAGARNQLGLTQKELAEKIGVSDKTISKWECGKSMPDILNILQRISIPNGVLIGFISVIIVLYRIEDYSHIGQNLLICFLAVVYAVVEHLVVLLLRQNVNEVKSD